MSHRDKLFSVRLSFRPVRVCKTRNDGDRKLTCGVQDVAEKNDFLDYFHSGQAFKIIVYIGTGRSTFYAP